MKEYLQSPSFSNALKALGVLLVALIVFWAGMAVGYRKAMFSYSWHSHYAQQFAEDHSPLFPNDGDADNMPNPHGAFGMVVAAHLPTIVIKGPNEAEKTVSIQSGTQVRSFHDAAASTTIKNGDFVVVIGSPDDEGRIVASFIRILPPPPRATSTLR